MGARVARRSAMHHAPCSAWPQEPQRGRGRRDPARAEPVVGEGEGGEGVWEWLRRRLGRMEAEEDGMRDYGEYYARMLRLGLGPVSRECYLQLYGGQLRRPGGQDAGRQQG